jgi:AcrR family transcriptional regulator
MPNLKQKILKEAAKLFSEFGFLGVSMEDIAKKLGTSKTALYYHFKNKKELYLNVLENTFENLKEKIAKKVFLAKSQKEITEKVIETYLEFSLKEKNLIKSLSLKLSRDAQRPREDLEIKNYISQLKEKIQILFQDLLNKESNFISFLLGTIDRVILDASLIDKKLNTKKVTSQIIKIFFPKYA